MRTLGKKTGIALIGLALAGWAWTTAADAQVGVQFGGGGGRGGGTVFGNPGKGRGTFLIEPAYRDAPVSDMKRCEQSYGQQAVEACMTAVVRDPGSAKAHRLLGDAFLATGRANDAYNEYSEALRLDADNDEAKRGREMAQRYLGGSQPPPPATSATAMNPYATATQPPSAPPASAAPRPAPAAQPVSSGASGPRDGEWSGRLQRQCTGFSDEGPASVNVAGNQFSGVMFIGGGGRDLRGTIDATGTVEASGKDSANNLLQVKGRLLSTQTLLAEGYVLNCKVTLLLGRGGAPVEVPSAMAAAAAPTPAVNPFDGEWSGTLTPRGGHYVVAAKVVDGKLTIKQDSATARVSLQGDVEANGQITLRGNAGDSGIRGSDVQIKGAFSGNMFMGQGRMGDYAAEMRLTRVSPPPASAPVVVAQAAAKPAAAPPPPAPVQQIAEAKPAEPPKAAEAKPATPAPAPASLAKAAEPVATKGPAAPPQTAAAPAKTQTASAPPATTVSPAPAPLVDKQAPTITAPAKLETDGPVVEIAGKLADNSAIVEFSINGQPVPIGAGGAFAVKRGVPVGTSELKLAAVDEWGNLAQKTIAVTRKAPAPAPQVAVAAPAASEESKATGSVQVASIQEKLKSVEFGTYRALVIGNNKYTKIRPLETAQNDASVVGKMLKEQYGFEVTVLTDATRQQIMEALYRMRAQLSDKDNLLVYYAGHGVRDDATGRGYWLPVDADPDLPTNWIPTTDLTDVIKAMRARHIMVVADSCYSGTLTRSVTAGVSRGPETDVSAWVKRIIEKRSRTVMSSGGLEPVMDGGGGTNHSVFAKAFIDALQDNPDVIDGAGLFATIRRPIVLNSDQTPEYADIRQAGHDGGDFLFVKSSAR